MINFELHFFNYVFVRIAGESMSSNPIRSHFPDIPRAERKLTTFCCLFN